MSRRDDNEATDSIAVPMVDPSEDEESETDTTYPSEDLKRLIPAEAMVNSRLSAGESKMLGDGVQEFVRLLFSDVQTGVDIGKCQSSISLFKGLDIDYINRR